MAIAIVATVGASNANSFCSEAEAVSYAATRLNAPSGWTTFEGTTCTESEKKALIEAQRDINVMMFHGNRTATDQALAWPRYSAPNPDSYDYFDSTEIPQRVKDAQCELAWQYIKAGTTDLASMDATRGVIQEVVGPLSTTWESGASRPTGLARTPRVQALLKPLLSGSANSLRVVRG